MSLKEHIVLFVLGLLLLLWSVITYLLEQGFDFWG